MTDFAALVPIVIVALSGIAAMLAEAFRQPGERMPIAGSRPHRPGGRRDRLGRALALGPHGMGVIRADNFSLFVNMILCLVGVLTMLVLARDRRA
jgi:hypothetical protein